MSTQRGRGPTPFVSAAPGGVPGGESGVWFVFRERDLLVLDGFALPRGATLALVAPGVAAMRVAVLGHLNGEPCFSAELPAGTAPPAGAAFVGLRQLYGQLPDELIRVAGRAVQMVHWDRTHRFCGACGAPTTPDAKTRALVCTAPDCALASYPRVSPAVIVAVERDDELLLARQPRFPPGFYSVLAGFVDPGESAEDAVHREVFEESGLEVTDVRYFASQAWPFPHSLMLGFQARWAGGTVAADGDELEDAAFFRVDALPQTFPGRVSIAQWLIHDFRARRGRG